MIYVTSIEAPVGHLTLAAEDGAVIGLWIAGQKYFMAGVRDAVEAPAAPPFDAARRWLNAYFAEERPATPDFPLAPRGTAFQRRVWQALREIPYGHTVTYGELATRLGSSARAVGSAVGRNPISILIPCHRVLGADGSLTGYAGGLENKKRLLALEGIDSSGKVW